MHCVTCGASLTDCSSFCLGCGKERASQTGAKNKHGAGWQSAVGWLSFVITMLLTLIILAACDQRSPTGNNSPPEDSTSRVQLFQPGDIPQIVPDGCLLPLTLEAHEEEIKLAVANDELGLRQMIISGKAIMLAGGTHVRVIDSKGVIVVEYQVRVLDGTYIGETGWTGPEFLKK